MTYGSATTPISGRQALIAARRPNVLMLWVDRGEAAKLRTAPPWRRVESLATDAAVPFVNGDAEARWIAERDAEPLPRLDDDEHFR
jgi:hypothetical protein